MERGNLSDEETLEFTLEDAYEHLKDLKEEMTLEVENLLHRSLNNETTTIRRGVSQDEIVSSYVKFAHGLMKSLPQEEFKDLPIPNTLDLHKTVIWEIQEVLEQIQQLTNSVQSSIAATKKNIAYLESNKEGLEKMRGACLGAIENAGGETNQAEIALSKRLFHIAKNDLFTVVDTMFPDEIGFKDILAEITQAFTKGGDDVYINVEPESYEFVKFLIEADVAAYHRNDKTKIRMMDLL